VIRGGVLFALMEASRASIKENARTIALAKICSCGVYARLVLACFRDHRKTDQ
jgi:hypothetical protein